MVQIALGAQKMAQAALEAQKNAPGNPLQTAAAIVPSSYFVAVDTVSWPRVHGPLTDFCCIRAAWRIRSLGSLSRC